MSMIWEKVHDLCSKSLRKLRRKQKCSKINIDMFSGTIKVLFTLSFFQRTKLLILSLLSVNTDDIYSNQEEWLELANHRGLHHDNARLRIYFSTLRNIFELDWEITAYPHIALICHRLIIIYFGAYTII